MKNKNEKDRRLDSLFSDYMESGESPSVNVTFKAKEYIRKRLSKEENIEYDMERSNYKCFGQG